MRTAGNIFLEFIQTRKCGAGAHAREKPIAPSLRAGSHIGAPHASRIRGKIKEKNKKDSPEPPKAVPINPPG